MASSHWGALELDIATLTRQGGGRRANSDAMLARSGHGLFAVADGVSTLPAAAETSRRCLAYLTLGLEDSDDPNIASVEAAIRTINGRLFAESRAQRSNIKPGPSSAKGSGLGACTLEGMLLKPDSALEFTVFHVGDAEVWINLSADVRRVTEPQKVQRPSKRDPSKMVTRLAAAMGAKPTVNPIVQQFAAAGAGGAVICTDGIAGAPELAADPWFTSGAENDAFEARLQSFIQDGQMDDASLVALRWRPAE
jgi:serine/threonine protein phosphatase PrpC